MAGWKGDYTECTESGEEYCIRREKGEQKKQQKKKKKL